MDTEVLDIMKSIEGIDGMESIKSIKDIKSVRRLGTREFNVLSVNTIKYKYPDLRQESKGVTFALTYGGTWITLVNNLGLDSRQAKELEANYHKLYKVSDQWVQERIDKASRDGYVTCAFGLRLDTPLLKQTVTGTSVTPVEAASEARTAGNALGQSWGLLNTRSGSEFMSLVRKSKYRLSIKPCAQIHDAQYYLVRDNIDTVLYLNKHLVHAVSWQDDPLIYHDKIKITGQVDVFWPDWRYSFTLPHDLDRDTLTELFRKHKEYMKEQGNRRSKT